jgi:hypothetical protein
MALGSTQSLTEMSTRNLPGGKGRSARKADNLTAIYEPIVCKMLEPRRLTALLASTACYRDSFTFFMTARSKAQNVFGSSNIGIVGSNPVWSIDVCLRSFCVCISVVLCVGSCLATGWSPSKESYKLSMRFIISELILNGRKPVSDPPGGKKKKMLHLHLTLFQITNKNIVQCLPRHATI